MADRKRRENTLLKILLKRPGERMQTGRDTIYVGFNSTCIYKAVIIFIGYRKAGTVVVFVVSKKA